MANEKNREQFVIDTFKRLNADYKAHVHAHGNGPMEVVVSTPAGATAAYTLDLIGDRYALYPQAEADAATLDQLKQDGLYLAPVAARHEHAEEIGKGRGK